MLSIRYRGIQRRSLASSWLTEILRKVSVWRNGIVPVDYTKVLCDGGKWVPFSKSPWIATPCCCSAASATSWVDSLQPRPRQKHQFGRHLLSHYRLFLIRVQQTSSFISSSSSSLSVCLCPEPITKVFLHFLLLHYVQFICSFHFILAICFHCHLIYIYLLVFLQWRFLPCNIFNWPARKPRRCHTIDSCGRIFAPVLHFSCNNFVW